VSVQVFIISWKGQHKNATIIYNQIHALQVPVKIVFSDPDKSFNFPNEINIIRRENHLFWGDKFKACMEFADFKNTLIIHADCIFENWGDLIIKYSQAIENIKQLAVYAPAVDFSSFPVNKTKLMRLNPIFTSVCFIDCIVFGISAEVIKRMKLLDYDQNIYGWGIGQIIAAFSVVNNKLLVIDNSMIIKHPKSRGYPTKEALDQMSIFLKQATNAERAYINLLINYLKFLQK